MSNLEVNVSYKFDYIVIQLVFHGQNRNAHAAIPIHRDEVRSFTLGSRVNPRQDERTMNTTRLLAAEGLQYEAHVEEGRRVQTGGRMDGSKRDLRLKIVGNAGFCDHAIRGKRRPGMFQALDVHEAILHDVSRQAGRNISRAVRLSIAAAEG